MTLGKETRKLCHIFVYHISMYRICYNSYIYNIFIYVLKVGWRLKSADIIFYMFTSLLSCYEEISKYLKRLMKIVNIAEEHLHIFWTTWRSSNEIFRKNLTYDNTIGHRKTGLYSISLPKIYFEKIHKREESQIDPLQAFVGLTHVCLLWENESG